MVPKRNVVERAAETAPHPGRPPHADIALSAGPWGVEVLNEAQRGWTLDELTTRAYTTTRSMFGD